MSSESKKELDPKIRARLEPVVKELFSSNDFHQVNMRLIAKKTGIGLNTIYMNYESKEKLLFSFINDWILQLDSTVAEHLQGIEDAKEKIRKTIWVILNYYETSPEIANIVLLTVPFKTWMADKTFAQKDLSTRIIGLFREGQQKGALDPDIPPEVMFDFFYGAMHRLVYIWLYLKRKGSLVSNTNLYCDMIWRALARPGAGSAPKPKK